MKWLDWGTGHPSLDKASCLLSWQFEIGGTIGQSATNRSDFCKYTSSSLCFKVAMLYSWVPFNSSPPNATYMCRWIGSVLVQIMACRLFSIISTNAGLLSIGPLGTNLSDISIKIQNFSFTKMHLKIVSAKWQPLFPRGNELNMVMMQWYVLFVSLCSQCQFYHRYWQMTHHSSPMSVRYRLFVHESNHYITTITWT